MSIRVAHVLNSPGHGGVPRVVQALIARHGSMGIRSHVFFLKGGPAGSAGYQEFARVVTTSPDGTSKFDVVTQLTQWLSDNAIQIVHTHSYRPNFLGRMAGALLRPQGVRIVSHYHNYYHHKWEADPASLALDRTLQGVTDQAIAVSDAVKNHVCQHVGVSPQKITVLTNGLDRERLRGGNGAEIRRELSLTQNALVVGLVGRICRQKGVDTFIDAAIALSVPRSGLSFVVIGEPEDAAFVAALREKVAAAGLARQVRLLSHREDIADVYAALDILCLPSRWEGFGLVLAEAMHLGLPIVASNVGAIPEVIGNSGAALLVPPEDPLALSAAISQLMRNPHLRKSMGVRGRQRATRYNWNTSSNQLVQIYKALVRRQ